MKKICVGILAATLLSACGSTSGLKSTAGNSKPDLKRYDAVLVKSFSDGTEDQKLPGHVGAKYAKEIARAIRATNRFDIVSPYAADTAGKTTLSVEGTIDRYQEGDEVIRYALGILGKGGAYLDATVDIVDEASGEPLGVMKVDKNTFPLGGLIAAYQTTDRFMTGSAEKIAEEVVDAKGK